MRKLRGQKNLVAAWRGLEKKAATFEKWSPWLLKKTIILLRKRYDWS
jgi:hypothetical protein